MAVSRYRGIVSPAYHVCRFKNNNVNKEYFHYLLRNKLYLPEFRRLSTGLRIGQWNLGFEDFKKLPYLLPSNKEQDEIVNYLNHKCSEIDNLISKKEKLISELESYKKSLIYEYVTGKKEVL
ncbi:MAG: restriction endonuclease subunit S [Intestinibacter bartlettii]